MLVGPERACGSKFESEQEDAERNFLRGRLELLGPNRRRRGAARLVLLT